jgi:hypothetical protein
MKLSIVALALAGLALSSQAGAQSAKPQTITPPPGKTAPLQAGRLQTKSYQPIGKNKVQVDLSVANAGELERTLHDYFKQRLTARGNPVGSSGVLAAKLAVQYAAPLPSINDSANNPPPPPSGVGAGTSASQGSPIPDSKAPAFRQGTSGPGLTTPIHLTITIYREQGGGVVWSGEATCNTPFASAKLTGKAMIDQLVESIDKTRVRDADCPL